MRIRQLDRVLIDRIAAGEVVERPASAVKELVENALDAGAGRIEVAIEAGGRRLIRVTDDGFGMDAADLALSVERHATSKLPDDDLTAITMFGFRGEALPSIASVASVKIATRTADASHGSTIDVHAGRKYPVRPGAQTRGTQVEVRDLFAATPARLKFLKSDRAESRAVSDIVNRLALAHPGVRFILTSAETAGFDYAACAPGREGARERLAQVLGKDARAGLLDIEAERDGTVLNGFASLPTWHRGQADALYLYVNGRAVRDKLLVGAVRAAYADFIPAGRYPTVALFLRCAPTDVDNNVHPAKAEVRFRDGGFIRGLIVGALKQTITGAMHRAADVSGEASRSFRLPERGDRARAAQPWQRALSPSAPSLDPSLVGFSAPLQSDYRETTGSEGEPACSVDNSHLDEALPLGTPRAQLHDNYLIAQTRDGFVIVDQHAAHERLVYEQLKTQRVAEGVASQGLLIPLVVELDPRAAERVIEQADHFASLGLSVEAFGVGAVLVRAMPAVLNNVDAAELVRDLAEALVDEDVNRLPLERRLDHYLATFACHHSVRSGRRMNYEEMNALLRSMEATPGSGQCNHGRPTYIELKLGDIERLFGRR